MMGHLGKGLQVFRKGLQELSASDPWPEKPTAQADAGATREILQSASQSRDDHDT